MQNFTNLQKQLFEMQDLNYREFQSRSVPNVKKERIIGIRIPQLRKFSKTYEKNRESAEFLLQLPHFYYEENLLHMMLITNRKDYSQCLEEIETFLPYIDNWAVCDLPAPKCFASQKDKLMPEIQKWISSRHAYTIRYGIGMLMRFFLDEDFSETHLEMVASVSSEEYYVNMMIAWYFATALAKQWDAAILYLTERRLSPWLHRKTIQKAVESYRITPEQKTYLRSLR